MEEEEPQQAITILKKGKVQALEKPYTPEQVKKFLYED